MPYDRSIQMRSDLYSSKELISMQPNLGWLLLTSLGEWLAWGTKCAPAGTHPTNRDPTATWLPVWRHTRHVRHASFEELRFGTSEPSGWIAGERAGCESFVELDQALSILLQQIGEPAASSAKNLRNLIQRTLSTDEVASSGITTRLSDEEAAHLERSVVRFLGERERVEYFSSCIAELLIRGSVDPFGYFIRDVPRSVLLPLLLIRHAKWNELMDVAQRGSRCDPAVKRRIQNRYASRHRTTLRHLCLQVDAMIDDPTQDVEDIKRMCLAVAKLHYERPVQHARLTAWAKRLRERRPAS